MGKGNDFWSRIEKQEKKVDERMASGEMDYLKKKGYSKKQIKGYLREDYHGQRKPNSTSYVLESDVNNHHSYRPFKQ